MQPTSFFPSTTFSIFIGFLLWLLLISFQIPYSLFELTHVEVLLMAAPLWLIPITWQIDQQTNLIILLAVLCGILFSMAFLLPKGISSGLMIIPWFGMSIFAFVKQWRVTSLREVKALLLLAAHAFLPVGIFWAVMARMGISFLGYDPTLVVLTAVHFHYAGFILPMVTAWLLTKNLKRFEKAIAYGIMLGIPLVALGISSTHYQWPDWIEVVCVTIMTTVATLVGFLYIQKGSRSKNPLVRICFTFGGLALVVGMVLAFCYGWRHVFVIETLTIPWMYAVHGTCNAIGFAGPVLLGWKMSTQV